MLISDDFNIKSDADHITLDTKIITQDIQYVTSDTKTITTDEMRGLAMPFSTETLDEKPHNVCVSCPRIGQTCDGPNFLAMSVDAWCEWCHLRRDFLKWKNNTLAVKAGVSKVSVDRIMAKDVKDLRITTMQAVTKALVNGTWGQAPCVLVTESEKEIYIDNPVIVAQCQQLQNKLDALAEENRAQLATVREEAQTKIDFLMKQVEIKDKQIEWMSSIINHN